MSKRIIAALVGLLVFLQAAPARPQVRRDSLESVVRFLSVDPANGEARSRFVFREAEMPEIGDSLAARLGRAAGMTAQRRAFTVLDTRYGTDPVETENIVVRIEGTAGGEDVLLVTAHFDAIGVRDDGWYDTWMSAPAPGADDNATGVAAALEIARLLRGTPPPFDVEFVLFSGEELGKLGSIEYVDACDLECGGKVLAVLNLDMIGWHDDGSPRGVSILTDYLSGWLAELAVDAIADRAPGLWIGVVKPGPSNWDHAPFWTHEWNGEWQHLPAVTFAEPLGETGHILYPYYHTAGDTIGNVDFEQAGQIADALVGFVVGFASGPPMMAILPSDVIIRAGNGQWGATAFEAGEEIVVRVNPRNIGGQPAGEGLCRVSVELENASGSRILYAGSVETPAPLRAATIDIPMTVSAREGGENVIDATIASESVGIATGYAGSAAAFTVGGSPETALLMHSFQPNPVSVPFDEAAFCVNLADEANMVVEILTLSGEPVGKARIGAGYGRPVSPGLNCIVCGDLFPGIGDLAGGVYVYRIALYPSSGPMERRTGRFAVVR